MSRAFPRNLDERSSSLIYGSFFQLHLYKPERDLHLVMFNSDTLNRFRSVETPFYYYDLNLLQRTLSECKAAADKYDFHVHYAMKANFNEKVIRMIREAGFGADCVSGNEVKKAI